MSQWLYMYDAHTHPDRFISLLGAEVRAKPAKLEGHRLLFVQNGEDGVRASVAESDGQVVLGTAYLVSDEALATLARQFSGYDLFTKVARFNDGEDQVHLFVLREPGEPALPSDLDLGLVREGLTYYHPAHRVDAYLVEACQIPRVFREPLIQRAKEATYKFEYNCNFRRLMPWKGVVKSPWGGAIGVVAPGEATAPHNHDEEETALIVSGAGELNLEGKKTPIHTGDVIFFPPFQTHTLLNTSENDTLEILFIWWGGVAEEEREKAKMRA